MNLDQLNHRVGLKSISKGLVIGLCATMFVFGCRKKEPIPDKPIESEVSATPAPSTPEPITSNPMSFDAAGSDSGKIDGLNTIHFEYDKSNLTSDTKSKLGHNAEWIKKHPETKIQIEGHCDKRGSIEYNLSLGERRASAVKSYLVKVGVAADRLSTISYGKEKPVAQGESDADMAKNRRANFLPIQ